MPNRFAIALSAFALVACRQILDIGDWPDAADGDAAGDAAPSDAATEGEAAAGSAYAAAVLADSPLAYYRFEDLDTVGVNKKAADSSGNLNDGTYSTVSGCEAALMADGVDGSYALHLQGDAACSIVTNDISAGNDMPFTIEAWVRVDNAVGNVIGTPPDGGAGAWLNGASSLFVANSGYAFAADVDDLIFTSSWVPTVTGSTTLASAGLTHVAVTYDGTSTLKLWANGQSVQTGTANVGSNLLSGNMTIGAVGGGGGWLAPFHGVVDELALYSHALTQAELANHYNAGK